MVTRTEEEWRNLFETHDGSGLSAAEFCQQNKLCPKYFSLRRKQLLGIKRVGVIDFIRFGTL